MRKTLPLRKEKQKNLFLRMESVWMRFITLSAIWKIMRNSFENTVKYWFLCALKFDHFKINFMMSGSKVPCDEIACALCTRNRSDMLACQGDSSCKGHNAASGM